VARVSLAGVEKRYRKSVAVRRLDLEVKDREFLTLLGPSGCGKSTVLNVVAGLETPTAGTVFIGGRDVTELAPQDRDVSMVFQSYALYPHKSVFENIAFSLKLRRLATEDIDRRVRDVATRLGIETLLARRPGELSGGQRQRVALGRALVRKPTVFLLDEPLSNLDAQLRTDTRAEIKRLHAEFATTTLYVTHDQVEAMTLSDRIAVMKAGELQQVGTPEQIYRSPANRFVAGFVGNPGMNFVVARVEDGIIHLPGMQLRLPKATLSEDVVVGLRPEDIELGTDGAKEGASGEVYAVELLGADSLVVLTWAGTRVTARAPSSFSARPGERIGIRFSPQRMLLFDPVTTRRIDPARYDQLQ
jgi:multiple sugar transport system ATP-binding protein